MLTRLMVWFARCPLNPEGTHGQISQRCLLCANSRHCQPIRSHVGSDGAEANCITLGRSWSATSKLSHEYQTAGKFRPNALFSPPYALEFGPVSDNDIPMHQDF